jgi:CAAX protease family protein
MSMPPPPRPDVAGPSGPPDRGVLPPATWNPLEAIAVFVLAVVVAGVLDLTLVQLLPSCGARFVVATLVGELAFGGAVLVWVRFVAKAPLAALGAPRRPRGDLGAGVVTGGILVVVSEVVVVLVQLLASAILGHQPAEPTQVDTCVQGLSLAMLGPVVILAAPFGEELLFRGFFYRGLRRRWRVWPSAVVSGLAFGLLHFQGVSFLLIIPGLVVVGIGLALVFERRQSILASMAAHATFNLVGFLSIALHR